MISLLLAAATHVMVPPDPAPSEPRAIVIGESYEAEVLGAERHISVILPPDYRNAPDQTWPVVYMLDGGMEQDLMLVVGLDRWNRLWGRSKGAIIVGIETSDRQRELLPPTSDPAEQERYPTAGQSHAFRQWIAETVKPLIDANYRHDGTAFLIGESAAGHFVIETWATRPDLFDGYAAISPSLQWSSELLSANVVADPAIRPRLYLSLADEGGATEAGMMRLLGAMIEGQEYCFSDRREDLVHANSLHGLLPEALQYLLPTEADWLAEYGLGLRCEQRGGVAAE